MGMLDYSTKRVRIGLLILGLGTLLSLWAWGNWIFRASTTSVEAPSETGRLVSDSPMERVQAVRTMPTVLLVGFFLVVVFLVSTYAMVRGSRRFRELILRKPPPPTPADDVWKMHKPPQEADEP